MIPAIQPAMWISVGSEIWTWQLIILAAILPYLQSTNAWETFTRTCSCLVLTACTYSMKLTTYTYLSTRAYPNHVVSQTTPCAYTATARDTLISALINVVVMPSIVTLWIGIISLMFFMHHWSCNFNSKFPNKWLRHDSIGNKLFGFVFSWSWLWPPYIYGTFWLQ